MGGGGEEWEGEAVEGGVKEAREGGGVVKVVGVDGGDGGFGKRGETSEGGGGIGEVDARVGVPGGGVGEDMGKERVGGKGRE